MDPRIVTERVTVQVNYSMLGMEVDYTSYGSRSIRVTHLHLVFDHEEGLGWEHRTPTVLGHRVKKDGGAYNEVMELSMRGGFARETYPDWFPAILEACTPNWVPGSNKPGPYKVGDRDDTRPHEDGWCGAYNERFICTRPKSHNGNHAAGTGKTIVWVW